MKKLKSLLVMLLVMMVFIPFNVCAEDKKPEANKEPVKVYVFRGETCGYCKAALEWFESIEDEYGDYFDLVTYEVWNDSNNQKLMEEVASFKGDNASGVPYILVGEYSYPNGFAADTKVDSSSDKTMGDELIERILKIYESDNRYDVMEAMNNKPNYDTVVGVVSVVIIVGLVAMAIITRKNSK